MELKFSDIRKVHNFIYKLKRLRELRFSGIFSGKEEWRSDFFHFKFIELVNAYYKKYPLDNVNNMEKYYKLYSAETGKQALRGGLETQIFQRWYHHKKEMKAINKRLNKRK